MNEKFVRFNQGLSQTWRDGFLLICCSRCSRSSTCAQLAGCQRRSAFLLRGVCRSWMLSKEQASKHRPTQGTDSEEKRLLFSFKTHSLSRSISSRLLASCKSQQHIALFWFPISFISIYLSCDSIIYATIDYWRKDKVNTLRQKGTGHKDFSFIKSAKDMAD